MSGPLYSISSFQNCTIPHNYIISPESFSSLGLHGRRCRQRQRGWCCTASLRWGRKGCPSRAGSPPRTAAFWCALTASWCGSFLDLQEVSGLCVFLYDSLSTVVGCLLNCFLAAGKSAMLEFRINGMSKCVVNIVFLSIQFKDNNLVDYGLLRFWRQAGIFTVVKNIFM